MTVAELRYERSIHPRTLVKETPDDYAAYHVTQLMAEESYQSELDALKREMETRNQGMETKKQQLEYEQKVLNYEIKKSEHEQRILEHQHKVLEVGLKKIEYLKRLLEHEIKKFEYKREDLNYEFEQKMKNTGYHLLTKGFDIAFIVETTGLPENKILEIQRNMEK